MSIHYPLEVISQCGSCLRTVILSFGKWFSTISCGEVLTAICTIAGFVIAIKQYKNSEKLSRQQSQRNQRETWFLHVIVLPQLSEINKFYMDLLKKSHEDKTNVESFCGLSHNDYILKMAELQESSKNIINQFFDHIAVLVKSYNQELGQQLEETIMELEDDYVNILNAYGRKKDVREREVILGNKQKLISLLNSGMSK